MKISIRFICSALRREHWPTPILPAIAVIGRSNVGKSSLLNSLFNVKVAKVSSTPGKTRLLNFYLLNEKYYLVDMPGYGYAKLSQTSLTSIKKFTNRFLETYPLLKGLILLIDSRLPLQHLDEIMLNYLDIKNITYIIILTKTDKLKKTEYPARMQYFKEIFKDNIIIPFSTKKKGGTKTVISYINQWLNR